jgi:hypothetical protein
MNPGEDGQPHAVLVGKDGQEVNISAGEGVVEILRQRDVEAKGEDDRPWCVGALMRLAVTGEGLLGVESYLLDTMMA